MQCDYGTNKGTWTSLFTNTAGMILAYNHTSPTIYPSGGTYYYQLRALNGVGYGVFSTATAVLLDATPLAMNPPVATAANINPGWIYLTWTVISTCTTEA